MPIYTPKTSRTDFKGGKNILASEHFTFIEGGATLDAAKIGSGYVPVGQAIAQDATTGKWTKFVAADIATYADFGILNVDWNCDGVNDGIAGEVITRGSVYDAKLVDVTPEFKEKTTEIRYVKEIV
ncbi:hypothetical protein E1Z16_11035 [Listeria monocytogenes]|uniref:Head decoration protein n=1 Tax=Listeria monocytogenes TaxID=1639 RepID=A0A9P1UEB5_LISMN|nr:hypothetical protein [Listeria monocytogenes]EAA0328930.1 hypothetical protein [Listeria monocytogenes]EAC2669032.1 hypothetical protein [Listeria monocytogenes]EAC2927784.1 hypothetical protein [Listeria monocytogenes]EAC2933894.1 hypothetical protein [Listeria monocytogenes]EAC3228734.1 hypothetical protein [Listeria monocytogenes]